MNRGSAPDGLLIGLDARLPFYQRGGISQYILHLLPALAALGSGHQFLVGQMGKDHESYAPADPAFRRINLYTPCHHRLERWSLGVEVRRHGRVDLWHSPDFIPPALGVKRRLITIHDLNFLYYPDYLTAESRRYYNGQIAWAVEKATHISADSEQTRQDLIELLGVPPEKVTTVHLAVNPLYQQPTTAEAITQTLAQHNLPHGFILAVGTLEPRKNLGVLLRAYHQLHHEAGVDVPLVLVGRRGWLDGEIWQTIAELGLDTNTAVRHLPQLTDQQLAHLYHAAGALATPSHYEGFGLPALEAMTCGCPVLVSNRGSLPEIVGPHGRVLPPDDPHQWATALLEVLSDTAGREKMIKHGREQAAHFSWEITAQKTLDLYEKAATQPHR